MVHHLAYVASSVVVPDGDHCIPAELLEALGVIGVFGNEVDISLDADVEQLLRGLLVHSS